MDFKGVMMKTRMLALLVACFFLNSALSQERGLPYESFGWLSGSWEVTQGGKVIEEQWMAPSGQMMIGMGRTSSAKKTLFFEFLQIVQSDTGTYYVARPLAKNATAFKLLRAGTNEIVFENLKHDFPQRIIYRMLSDKTMLARVEGLVKGSLKWEEFTYTRSN
ncbi:MAG: hypothetical protein HW374_316 [Bacteroidetes bacterium]|nr:hypothetical protein [Bacteroidota bacterium]